MRIVNYGITMTESKQLMLIKESSTNYPVEQKLQSPEKIFRLMHDVFNADNLPEEHLWLIALAATAKPVGFFEVSHGTVSSSLVDTKAVFSRLLLVGASQFVLVHNHPSGDPNASQEDIKTTKKIQEAAKIMGYTMCDHIICGSDGYFSFYEKGMM